MFRRRSQIVITLVALASLLLTACGSTSSSGPAKGQPIKLGAVLTMTTGASLYGKQQEGALKLALKQVNDAGGINGSPLELIVEDSGGNNSQALTAFNKVMEQKPVALVGPVLGTQTLTILPEIDKEGIPTISLSGTRKVTQQGSKNIFRTSIHDGVTKVALAKYALDDLKKSKFGLIVVGDEWGYSGRDIISAVLKDRGLTPAGVETYKGDDKDMSAQLLNLKKAGADVIITQGYAADTALIFKQVRQLNLGIPVVTSTDGQLAAYLDITTGADIEGLTAVGLVIPTFSDDAKVKQFVTDFEKLNGFKPDMYAALQYDGINFMIAAMKKYGTTRDAIRKGMTEISYEAFNGTFHSDKEGNALDTVRVMKYDKNKVPTVLKTIKVAQADQK